jgi:hypothetical protein
VFPHTFEAIALNQENWKINKRVSFIKNCKGMLSLARKKGGCNESPYYLILIFFLSKTG